MFQVEQGETVGRYLFDVRVRQNDEHDAAAGLLHYLGGPNAPSLQRARKGRTTPFGAMNQQPQKTAEEKEEIWDSNEEANNRKRRRSSEHGKTNEGDKL
jgi:hypothetical protein